MWGLSLKSISPRKKNLDLINVSGGSCSCGSAGIFGPKHIAIFRALGRVAMTCCLKGVAVEWESSTEVRDQLRAKKKLFSCDPTSEEVKVSVKCGEWNFAVLKPLAKRLIDSDGNVGQLKIPDILRETLCCK